METSSKESPKTNVFDNRNVLNLLKRFKPTYQKPSTYFITHSVPIY